MEKVKTVKIEDWTDIQELAAMSIGTDKGRWWAEPAFGSELWLLRAAGKVDGTTAGKVKTMILDSVAWLKADGLVKDITCVAERIGKNEIRYVLTIFKPTGQTVSIKDVWHGVE
ncbi:phage GP46 family protein [Treponema lecithinolyticum]|jgi:phage protein GP46|uniref:phage GP46 family protein n=1 Tax=Treponema lecithinolyticum TaxID=53418 RepID=UPI0028EFD24A|nr:phage GP46 family protein [Treponema lecithinolyticum]